MIELEIASKREQKIAPVVKIRMLSFGKSSVSLDEKIDFVFFIYALRIGGVNVQRIEVGRKIIEIALFQFGYNGIFGMTAAVQIMPAQVFVVRERDPHEQSFCELVR